MTLIGAKFVVPEIVASHFHIREGDIIADYGAGSGFFLPALSTRTGATGKIYACEIQKALVEKLSAQAHSQNLGNVFPLWCDLEEENGIKIQTGTVDVAVLINTLFLIEDKNTAVKEMGRVLREGGKFFVIDWTESFAGMGPQAEHVVSPEETKALFESNGFIFEREFESGAHHYGLAFRKL